MRVAARGGAEALTARHGKGRYAQTSYCVAPRAYSSGLRDGEVPDGRLTVSTTVCRQPPLLLTVAVDADAEQRSTGGFSPGLAVSEVYDGDWVDDRRCGKGTVTYSNGEVEVCSFQGSPDALGREGTRVGEGMRWDRHGRQAWRLMDGKIVEKVTLVVAEEWSKAFGVPCPHPAPAEPP